MKPRTKFLIGGALVIGSVRVALRERDREVQGHTGIQAGVAAGVAAGVTTDRVSNW